MNRIKETFPENSTSPGKKNHLLRIPITAVITFFLMISHNIRYFFFSFREHPVRQRFIVSVLSICLIVTSLPLQLSAQELTEEENNTTTHELVSFSELPDEIKEQTVAEGTPIEELELPSSLAAAESFFIEKPKEKKADIESSDDEQPDETPMPDAGTETGAELPDKEEETSLTPLNGEENTENPENITEQPPTEQTEETVDKPDTTEEETEEVLTVEGITVDGVTWSSAPEYDGDTEGTYVFSPVLPQGYSLKQGATQPEIIVTVGDTDDITGAEEDDTTIDEDTTWDSRILENQKLTINQGKNLTINGVITIKGNVTIEGGGSILRGNKDAGINVTSDSSLTIGNVTIDGKSLNASRAMITLQGASLTIGNGCRIQNCKNGESPQLNTDGNGDKKGGAIHTSGNNNVITLNDMIIADCSAEHQGGAIELAGIYDNITLNSATITGCSAAKGGAICAEYYYNEGKSAITLNNPTIENCTASFYGGAICLEKNRSAVTINGGIYRKNTTVSSEDRDWGGGAIYTSGSLLYINGGNFIGNSTNGKGGAIHHCGLTGTETYINGGYFEGNICNNSRYTGSGAIYHSILESGINDLYLSGNARFAEGGANGTDGIYLDKNEDNINNGKPKEIFINNTLNYPITIYAEAVEGDFIAEGNNYTLLYKDMKQINYVHATNSALKLYADLAVNENKAVLTSSEPEHKYYIHYIIPYEATGTIEADNTGYKSGDTFTVKSGEKLMKNGFPFMGWNAKKDGTGEFYETDKNYTMPDNDLYLYAVFQTSATEYRIKFDLNGITGDCPDPQIVPYGGYLQTVEEPVRRGYSFKGWYKDTEGTERNRWNFEKTVENNTKETSVTLYAKWVDDIAPVLGATSYNTGYKDFKNWIIRKKNLIVTVPITEEGSGVKRADYVLRPEKGNAFSGEAQIEEDEILVTGSETATNDIQQPIAKITVDQDFKGTISLSCVDNADNVSASRTLTAAGGGVIVEDHAPEIRFSAGKNDNGTVSVMVSVKDDVDNSGGSYITGGIAEVNYRIDENAEKAITGKNFSENIVPFCDFTVDITERGSHTLTVTAIDHAGNQNQQNIKVSIAKKRTSQKTTDTSGTYTQTGNTFTAFSDFAVPVSLQIPQDEEPDTGDTSTQVEVYATIAMIAGLSYLLLYFTTGKNGMMEEEKNKLVAKWIRWAKQGRKYRRLVALVAIFCLLFYYHSIGKRVTVEWKEVYGK